MICPSTVPTFPWKSCDDTDALIHAENYSDDTGSAIIGAGGRVVASERPIYRASLSVAQAQRVLLETWHSDTISHGTAPFAFYGDHGGTSRWWVVKLTDPKLTFKEKTARRSTTIEVYILGYADTVTEPASGTAGTATDITCT